MGARVSTGLKSEEELVNAERRAIEKSLVKAMQQRAASGGASHVKSLDGFLMKFPKIDRSFKQVGSVFKKFDQSRSGTIDLEQLKACFRELQVEFSDEEVRAFYEESDMDCNRQINFKEFIVVLALVYLLGKPINSHGKSRIGLPQLEASFEIIEDAFVFLDKNGDGYVSKEEIIAAVHESSSGTSKTDDNIGIQRFEEMDWDRDGKVTFKEFLFAFTSWVGVEDEEIFQGGAEVEAIV